MENSGSAKERIIDDTFFGSDTSTRMAQRHLSSFGRYRPTGYQVGLLSTINYTVLDTMYIAQTSTSAF